MLDHIIVPSEICSFKSEAVSLAVAAAFIFYLVVEWWRVIDFTYSIIV